MPEKKEGNLRSIGTTFLNAAITYAKFDLPKAIECCRHSVEARKELKDRSSQDADAFISAENYLKQLEQMI